MAATLNWENLTAPDFAQAVEHAQGTCVVPLGVIEKHGQHLPLGTDLIAVRRICEEAVKLEPAVVFPPYFFTQIHEARHQPGTIAIPFRLMFDLLDATCDEIARNGLKKIILVNGHGGNGHFLPYFAQSMLERPRDYMLYVAGLGAYYGADNTAEWKTMKQSTVDGHAGEEETSHMLADVPELVRLDQASESGMPLGRAKHLGGLYNAIWWYAEYPNHFAGEAHTGSAQKGEFLRANAAKRLAELIRVAKADTTCAKLTEEFYSRTQHGK